MKNKVIISFNIEQTVDNDTDISRLKAEGILENTDKGYRVEYTEPHSGMGKSLSVIEVISNKYVRLIRNGLYQTDFNIEESKAHTALYKSPFGDMDVEIIAHKVDASLTNRGGTIRLSYELRSGEELISENKLNININVN